MEYVILGLLILKSQTVYELNKAFEQGVSLIYSASYGSLQSALKNLLTKQWATFEEQVENGRSKKRYIITPAGQAAFREWMMSGDIPLHKLEAIALCKVYFLGLVEDADHKREIIRGILEKIEAGEARMRSMDEQLKTVHVPEQYKEVFRYQMHTLDYGLRSHRFSKEWFEELLQKID